MTVKFRKDLVQYRERSPNYQMGQICGNCKFFSNPNQCDIVVGFIGTEAWCNRWTNDPGVPHYPQQVQYVDPRTSGMEQTSSAGTGRIRAARPGEKLVAAIPRSIQVPSKSRPRLPKGTRVQLPTGQKGTVLWNMTVDHNHSRQVVVHADDGQMVQIDQSSPTRLSKAQVEGVKLATAALERTGSLGRHSNNQKLIVMKGRGGKAVPYADIVQKGLQVAKNGPVKVFGQEAAYAMRGKIRNQMGLGVSAGDPTATWEMAKSAWGLWPRVEEQINKLNAQFQAGAGTPAKRAQWADAKRQFDFINANIQWLQNIMQGGKAAWDAFVNDPVGTVQTVGTQVYNTGKRLVENTSKAVGRFFGFNGLGIAPLVVIGVGALVIIGIIALWEWIKTWVWGGPEDGGRTSDKIGPDPPPPGYDYDPSLDRYYPIGFVWDNDLGLYVNPDDPDQTDPGIPATYSGRGEARRGGDRCEPCFYAEEDESRWWFGDFDGMGYVKENWWLTPGLEIPGFTEEWEGAVGDVLNGIIWVGIAIVGISLLPLILKALGGLIGAFRSIGV